MLVLIKKKKISLLKIIWKCSNLGFVFSHQVNLLSHLPPRCPPLPFPPQRLLHLLSLSQAAPRNRTGRFPHPSAQSGWPGSDRRGL